MSVESKVAGEEIAVDAVDVVDAIECAGDKFDFTANLSGPSNMSCLAAMMKERNIANDESLEFTQVFVEQFYNDTEHTPGDQCMYNGEPTIWGEIVWDHLHLLTYYYPSNPSDDVKRAAYQHVHALRFILPCEHCRQGFRFEILQTPVEEYLQSRETFIEWGIEVHTSVNKRLGKPPFDADATFKRLLAREHRTDTSTQQQQTQSKTAVITATQTKTAAVAASVSVAKQSETTHNEIKVVARREMTKHQQPANAVKAIGSSNVTTNTTQQQQQQRTNYGNRVVSTANTQSLQSVRSAMKRNAKHLTLQQKANLQKLQLAQKAKGIKEPAECKSCGSKKKLTPSVF